MKQVLLLILQMKLDAQKLGVSKIIQLLSSRGRTPIQISNSKLHTFNYYTK